VKIGDLVRLTDVDEDDTRGLGVVMGWDVYKGRTSMSTHHKEWDSLNEPLAKVSWSGRGGAPGWVLVQRLEVVNEAG